MPNVDRNTFVDGTWVLKKVENIAICDSFDCGDDDLNEYFHVDAVLHKKELLTQTYCLEVRAIPDLVIALLDFCNDTVLLKKYSDAIDIDIDERKRYPSLPAVKLTRFGVVEKFQRMNIGTHALNMAKKFFTIDNRTGCRFITVDAYNKPEVIKFYEKNGFKRLTDKDKNKNTRSLFFDLKRLESI